MNAKQKQVVTKTAKSIVNNLEITAKSSFSQDARGQLFDELYRSLSIRFRNSGIEEDELKKVAGEVVGKM